MIDLSTLLGFDWDSANINKNWVKHKVSNLECEQIFLNDPLLLLPDTKHSSKEIRYYVLGRTDHDRLLLVTFTIRRQQLIRIISSRLMNKKERLHYEKNS